MRKRLIILLLVVIGICLLLFWQCRSGRELTMQLHPPPPPSPTGMFQAGAASIDITPPPGYPMGGFAMIGKVSRGWWTRLNAHALYLSDAGGRPLVLVVCDLWAIPGGLVDRVTELLQASGVAIGREQIVISATHTHHSPGNYMSSKVYNLFASPQSGFSEPLFQFFAGRVAAAAQQAVQSKQPAALRYHNVSLAGVFRNRSLEAFQQNTADEQKAITQRISQPEQFFHAAIPPDIPEPSAFQAINPDLQLLGIYPVNDVEGGEPIALAGFMAAHPTVMGPSTEVYNSDFFGAASILLQRHFMSASPAGSSPVIALFNGAEGDISANWFAQDRQNAVRIGGEIADRILQGLQESEGVEIRGEISYRYETVNIADRPVEDIHNDAALLCNGHFPGRTAEEGYPGAPTLGGAEDGRTLYYDQGFREGVRNPECDSRQGSKRSAADQVLATLGGLERDGWLTQRLSGLAEWYITGAGPTALPLGVYTIGPLVLATLPGEFTVAQGERIKRRLQAVLGGDKTVMLIGLANEYLSYFTTPAEYEAQHYEGASMALGPLAGLCVEQELARIAVQPANSASYDLKPVYRAGDDAPPGFGEVPNEFPWATESGLATLIKEYGKGRTERYYPGFSWQDSVQRLTVGMDALVPVTPRVAIERRESGKWTAYRPHGEGRHAVAPEDDRSSLNLVTVMPARQEDTATWQTLWMWPDTVPAGEYRFRVRLPSGNRLYSEAFRR